MVATAKIGPTGYADTWGILWEDFPYMEYRGGYSGSFDSKEQAEEYARNVTASFNKSVIVVEIPNVAEEYARTVNS